MHPKLNGLKYSVFWTGQGIFARARKSFRSGIFNRMRLDTVSAIAILMAPLLFGLIIGSTGPSIDTMRNEVKNFEGHIFKLAPGSRFEVFDEGQAAVYSSLVTIGAMIGSIMSGYITENFGFKSAILVTIPMYLAGSFILYVCKDVMLLFAARTLTGIAVGINSFVVPTFLADFAPVHLRGRFGTANQLCITIGILAVYFLGMLFRVDDPGHAFAGTRPSGIELNDMDGFRHTSAIQEAPSRIFCNWRALALVNALPALILAMSLAFIPESPSWLASKGRIPEASYALARLRGDQETKEELVALSSIHESVKKLHQAKLAGMQVSTWALMKRGWKQLGIAIALQFFQQFSGINAIMFYCTSIMREAKVEQAELVSVSVMLEQVLVTALAVMLMDLAGRKVLLIVGASVMAAACGLFGLYFFLQSIQATSVIMLMYVSIYAYMAAFSIGVGAIPWLILGEIFPVQLRSVGASVATLSNWIFAFIVTLAFQPAASVIGVEGVLWTFGICCVGLVVFAALAVPETKGKSIEEIQEYFEPKAGSKEDEKASLIQSPAPVEQEAATA